MPTSRTRHWKRFPVPTRPTCRRFCPLSTISFRRSLAPWTVLPPPDTSRASPNAVNLRSHAQTRQSVCRFVTHENSEVCGLAKRDSGRMARKGHLCRECWAFGRYTESRDIFTPHTHPDEIRELFAVLSVGPGFWFVVGAFRELFGNSTGGCLE